MKSLLAISFAILLPVVCNSAAARPVKHPAASSWPLSFFAGHTKGEGSLRQVGAGRYVGTLTDAAGPIEGEATANRLQLRYTLKGAFRLQIEQRLELQPDGRTIRNLLIARKFGMPITSLSETIRKTR